MRIAYVCNDPGVPVFGQKGSSIHCQEVMRVFQQRGYEVELFANRIGDSAPDDLANIKTHRIRTKLSKEVATRERQLTGLNTEIYQHLRQAQPFDLVYERYALWSYAATEFAQHSNVPSILEVNSPLIHEQKTYRTLIDQTSAETIRAKCFKNAESIIAVSDEVKQRLQSNYFAREKTSSIGNGVNTAKFQSMAFDRAESKELTIVFVGTLKPWHGVDILLNAFNLVRRKNRDLKLKIIGDGPEKEKLVTNSLRFDTDVSSSIEWMGALPNSRVANELSQSDIAVAPYPDLQDFYFSPLKLLEYMAGGLAIVASQIGQIDRLIEDDVTGRLVKSGAVEQLAESLTDLCNDRDARIRLGKAARDRVLKNHTWHHVVDRILDTVSNRQPARLPDSGVV